MAEKEDLYWELSGRERRPLLGIKWQGKKISTGNYVAGKEDLYLELSGRERRPLLGIKWQRKKTSTGN